MSNLPVENPYAAPLSTNPYLIDDQPNDQIFRSGQFLVMHKKTQLPDCCIKSNVPTTERLKRELHWHHPLIYLLILVQILLYVIVAMFVRRTATIQIPLSPRYKSRRLMWMLSAWATLLLSISGIVVAGAFGDSGKGGQNWITVIGLLSFPLLLLISGLIGIFGCRVVYAKKIVGDYVKIGGVCEEFLSGYDEFPNPF